MGHSDASTCKKSCSLISFNHVTRSQMKGPPSRGDDKVMIRAMKSCFERFEKKVALGPRCPKGSFGSAAGPRLRQGTRAVSSSTPSPASERNCKRTRNHMESQENMTVVQWTRCLRAYCNKNFRGWIAGFNPFCQLIETRTLGYPGILAAAFYSFI